MSLNEIKFSLRKFGFWKTFHLVIYKAVNKIVYLKVFSCVVLTKDRADETLLKSCDKNWHGFLEKEKLLNYVKPENELEQ